MYNRAICNWGCLNSTDHGPWLQLSAYGSVPSFTALYGRRVRMKLVGETSSLPMTVNGVNLGALKTGCFSEGDSGSK